MQSIMAGEFDMLAKTMHGLEDILQKELEQLGAKDIVPGRRMVAFRGDKKILYKANIHLRTALRVLVPIIQFKAKDADEIYQYLYDNVCWDQFLTSRSTFAFDTVVYSEKFTHSKFVAYRAKDAISDYFKDKGERNPNVSVSDPDVHFHIHIADEIVTLALDSSGESLHRRGYRLGQNDAPISEVLAAGILLRAGWDGQCDLLDPMCGSGTFLTEAALIALSIPPGIFRSQYAFERWPEFDADLLSDLLEDWEERQFEHKIYGSDAAAKAIAISRGNIRNTGVQKYIELTVQKFEDYTEENRPAKEGIIVMNPPYGERMRPYDLEKLYELIGSTLKHTFMGWKAWIISGSIEEGYDAIGLKHFHREKLFNGPIECELRAYELFEGKRNEHLQQLSEMGLLPDREEREAYLRGREKYVKERQEYRKERSQAERNQRRRNRFQDREGQDRYQSRERGDRDNRFGREGRDSFSRRDGEQRDFRKRSDRPSFDNKRFDEDGSRYGKPNLACSSHQDGNEDRPRERRARRERIEDRHPTRPRGSQRERIFIPRSNHERNPEED